MENFTETETCLRLWAGTATNLGGDMDYAIATETCLHQCMQTVLNVGQRMPSCIETLVLRWYQTITHLDFMSMVSSAT